MNKQEQINKLVEEALNSVDDVQRAATKPYLFTRINARMNKGTETFWEKVGWFIGRPAVAFTGLCMVILINAIVIMNNRPSDSMNSTELAVQTQTDEFSYTVATIYDNENTQP
jgi:hypothetical protein